MFSGCTSLTYLNLSNFNIDNVTNITGMFSGCNSLKKGNVITENKKILKEINN